jgi:hypothetical protein
VPDQLNESNELGAWAGDSFSETVTNALGVGADDTLPETTRFIAAVAKLVRRRLAQAGYNGDPSSPAVFLLKPTPPAKCKDQIPKRVPMLDGGHFTITGRIWFVSAVVVSGHFVDSVYIDDDDMFSSIASDQELLTTPAIIFDPRISPSSLRYYPNGISNLESCETLQLLSNVSLSGIYTAIDQVYKNNMVTPEAQSLAGKFWKDGSKWWPTKQAEDLVQLYLRVGLTTAFPTCVIRAERTLSAGRLDLIIEESHPTNRGDVTLHAVLELKVLRSFGSTGNAVSETEVKEWIQSGVQQAAAYRDDIGAKLASLCCFDMRKSHSSEACFSHVKGLAERLIVDLKLWYLFATSKQYRDFTTADH